MSHLIDAGDLRYVLADATGPTSNNFIRNYRSFLWVGDAIFVIDDVTRRTKFITAILPVTEGADLPQIERLKGIEHIDVRVRQNGTVTDIYMNLEADGSVRHRNANLVMLNGWETDAYMFAFTYPECVDPNDPDAITRTMVIDGSYQRREGKVVLDSLSKVYICATKEDDGTLDVQLQGQPVINAL